MVRGKRKGAASVDVDGAMDCDPVKKGRLEVRLFSSSDGNMVQSTSAAV